jgi:hypothetical protein
MGSTLAPLLIVAAPDGLGVKKGAQLALRADALLLQTSVCQT